MHLTVIDTTEYELILLLTDLLHAWEKERKVASLRTWHEESKIKRGTKVIIKRIHYSHVRGIKCITRVCAWAFPVTTFTSLKDVVSSVCG
jgi:hypothetical protein